MSFWGELQHGVSQALERPLSLGSIRQHGHGCLGPTYVAHAEARTLFIKTGKRACLDAFAGERDGLLELATAKAVRVPSAVCAGVAAGRAYLVMDYLELGSDRAAGARRLGHLLASQHRVTSDHFGWHRDNTIGLTHQANRQMESWPEFFACQRLRPQLQSAQRNGLSSSTLDLGYELSESLSLLFTDYVPAASLLHGDLWSGNYGVVDSVEPVVFDPAVYYGDRECDIAMTSLFGGFPPGFYTAYEEVWPLAPGFATRETLYNLFHVLNHFNMFGAPYGATAHTMLTRLIRELR